MEIQSKKTIVLGGGISGNSANHLLQSLSKPVILVDRSQGLEDSEENAREILDPTHVEEIIKSPGIYPSHPWLVLARERNIPIVSEIDLAHRYFTGKCIGITGTDGKSTTAALTQHLLKLDFNDVELGGNIGRAFSEFANSNSQLIVLELSSYQLEDSQPQKLVASAILNLAIDHLERHGCLENYAKAKLRIADLSNPDHVFVTNRKTLEQLELNPKKIACSVKLFGFADSTSKNDLDASIDLTYLSIQTKSLLYDCKHFPLEGSHNLENLAASILLAESLGAKPESIQIQIRNFQGLAHRFEKFHQVRNWTFVNDSKSTNLHSLLAWLNNFIPTQGRLHLLLGGRTKQEPLDDLISIIPQLNIHVYLFGEAKTNWRKDFEFMGDTISYLDTMEDALTRIRMEFTHDPDSPSWVVLSPACSSFDQFKNFEDRGNQFKDIVYALFGRPE
jgi:UDP-N-acetylmuramoylalanine--D-glutamate ligase